MRDYQYAIVIIDGKKYLIIMSVNNIGYQDEIITKIPIDDIIKQIE